MSYALTFPSPANGLIVGLVAALGLCLWRVSLRRAGGLGARG